MIAEIGERQRIDEMDGDVLDRFVALVERVLCWERVTRSSVFICAWSAGDGEPFPLKNRVATAELEARGIDWRAEIGWTA